MEFKTITILGANGTMGSNVAGIFASFGNAKVYMVARSLQDAKTAKKKAMMSVRSEAISPNLIPMTYNDLEECISNSDFIFESVAEDLEVKKQVYMRIKKFLKLNAIIGTGTSGLSVNKLSEFFDDQQKKRFMGVHMFNPPYVMTLCELIPNRHTDSEILAKVKTYLEYTLYREVVEVKDEPAFMGNRIGFQFLNESLQLAEKYKSYGGIDYIDAIFGGFTGRTMAPLVTADFVGLDVHKAIVDNVYYNTNDIENNSFKLPSYIEELITENKLGRKTGEGLYRKITDKSGNKTREVFDIDSMSYRPIKSFSFNFAEKMKKNISTGNYSDAIKSLLNDKSQEAEIAIKLLIKYIFYSLYINEKIGEDVYSSDKVMATGFNWIPPLALIDAINRVYPFEDIVQNRMENSFLNKYDLKQKFYQGTKSTYDFRPFIKAK